MRLKFHQDSVLVASLSSRTLALPCGDMKASFYSAVRKELGFQPEKQRASERHWSFGLALGIRMLSSTSIPRASS